MARIVIFLTIISLLGCIPNEPTKELENKEQTIVLFWVGWACDCPQWMRPEDYTIISESLQINCDNDSTCIEIKPADDSLIIPEMYWKNPCGGKTFRFTGSFYKEKQKHPGNDGRVIFSKTFRYTNFEYIPTNLQVKNDSIYKIKDYEAYYLIYKLDFVKNYLNQKKYKECYVWHSECPNDTNKFYTYELVHRSDNGQEVVDEKIRMNPNDSSFERINKETNEFEKI